MIVVLAGGVGAARFLQGIVQVMPQEEITVIVNTGDDRDFYGLHVSPDSDIVMYTLAGMVDEKQGWGIRNDTYNTMQQLTHYGDEDWFLLGDRDLATHIHRTSLLRQGKTLSEVIEEFTCAARSATAYFTDERSACAYTYSNTSRLAAFSRIYGQASVR